MKLALVIPANRSYCPYLDIYTDVLNEFKVSYDVIYFNRRNIKEDGIGFTGFKKNIGSKRYKLLTFIDYLNYSRFVKKTIKKNKYDKVIVFSSQLAIFLSSFLRKNLKGNYGLDYRDISIEQKLPFLYKKVAQDSVFLAISSKGFIPYLPETAKFIISHNFRAWTDVSKYSSNTSLKEKETIRILTIGAIRDYKSNKIIIDSFKNSSKFILDFVGEGPESDNLRNYCLLNNIHNVSFVGYYRKEDEVSYIEKADIMNIYYPDTILHTSSISNRFYHALLHKLPMIVSKGSLQADYVEEFNLGICVTDTDNILDKTQEMITTFSGTNLNQSSTKLIDVLAEDYRSFKNNIIDFIS